MRRLISTACATGALLLTGCREAAPPYAPPVSGGGDEAVRQVTFGSGQDRDPRWSPDGATLLYHTSHFGTMPQAAGVLLSLDPVVVRATPVFEILQRSGEFLLATPVYSPTGDRIAYTQLQSVDPPVPCPVPTDSPPHVLFACTSQPLLHSAVLRVRSTAATGSYLDDPAITVQLPGTDARLRDGTDTGTYVQQIFPFQELHRTEHALLFRPSWSPAGDRLVISNGLRLLIWRVGSATFDTVPGTADAVSPAWSPAGDWIAFTELVRGDSTVVSCTCASPGRITTREHLRTLYDVSARNLVLVRPDGSVRVVLGEGEDPAWSPDGQYIYARRDGVIVRIPRSGGDAVVIPHTAGARSPSVSPDDRWLAFSRVKPQQPGDHDIWLVSLAQ